MNTKYLIPIPFLVIILSGVAGFAFTDDEPIIEAGPGYETTEDPSLDIEGMKVRELKGMPRIKHRGHTYVDMRKQIKPSDGTVPPGKAHEDMFKKIRRRFVSYGVVIPNDMKLSPKQWQELGYLYDGINTTCGKLGEERALKFKHIWDKATWAKAGSKEAKAMQIEANKRGVILKRRGRKNQYGIWERKVAILTRKEAPELFTYEDDAERLWVGFMFEWVSVLMEQRK